MRPRTIAVTPLLLACALGLSLNNCASEEDQIGIDESELVELQILSGDSVPLRAVLPSDTAVVVTLDCKVPSHVDMTGAVIAVDAPTFSQSSELAGQARGGYWQWAGVLEAGEHQLTVKNVGAGAASCGIDMRAQAPADEDTCTSWSVHRSEIGSATHLRVGDTSYGRWEALPSSGNHWGAWGKWNTVYERPMLRGFLLHNLEHGGVVLSYGCTSADESQACADAQSALIDLANEFGKRRIIVTPDPDQPEMFAVRAWRWAYSSSCLEPASALGFMQEHFRNGREDIDADPPADFDPSVTDSVPCEVLMAAPDSC